MAEEQQGDQQCGGQTAEVESCLYIFVFFADQSGILFCMLPTLYLVPKLYGKIEPLLGMEPRSEKTALGAINGKVILVCLGAFAVAVAAEMLAESGMSLIDWEADWAGSGTALAAGMVVAAAAAVIVLVIMKKRAEAGKQN